MWQRQLQRRTPQVALAGALGALGALVAVASGCSGATSGAQASSTGSSTPIAATVARISITPGNGHQRVSPSRPVTVRASGGTLTSVVVRGPAGEVAGRLVQHRTVWHSRGALRTDTRYTVRAAAVDGAGRAVTKHTSFRTLKPTRIENTTIFEAHGQTYGVGMPIILSFSTPVVDKRAVERALSIRTSRPVVGAWYWDGDSTLYFRPRSYWPANTRVRFTGDLDGVEAAPGVYGVHTLTQSFRIGRSLIAVASTTDHHVRIYLDRKLYGDWPISTGKPGDDTPNGTYLTIEKGNPVEMKGPGYDLMVPWSVRFTWSGDYMHDAYWSVGQQGFVNVSHGCVNLSPANAETYYNLAVPGDPVTVTGSPRAGSWGNGWTVWFLTWKQLLRGSALHLAGRAAPHGSSLVAPSALRGDGGPAPLRSSAPNNAAA
jgi:lipoprotein-anchoring transpeptidase ErfK/SrfK